MLDRLMGVLTLKAPVYKEIAHDKSATTTAAIIVVVVALFSGVVGAVLLSSLSSSLPPGTAGVGNPLVYVIRTVITSLIGWVVGAWVIAFVAKTFFGGKTDTSEMLRVFGFTQIFQVLSVVPCIGAILGLVLSLVGAVIGIREASEFDTTKAVLTAVVAFIVLLVVSVVVGTALALVGLA